MLRLEVFAVCCVAMWAQSALPPATAFEVASVKSTVHGRDAAGTSISFVDTPTPVRLSAQNASLRELLEFAFDLESYQIAGPVWLNDADECFDIDGKAGAASTRAQFRSMLTTLLSERFHLSAHKETKPAAAYNLVADARGESVRAKALHKADPGDHRAISSRGGDVIVKSSAMTFFASWLSHEMHRPVFDATGLPGTYNFEFQFDPNSSTTSDRPWLSQAIVQDLGLKLENSRQPVEVLIVDHIDRQPTGN